MKVYLNLQTAAFIPYYIAFSNIHLISFPQTFFLRLVFKSSQPFSSSFIQRPGFCSIRRHWSL